MFGSNCVFNIPMSFMIFTVFFSYYWGGIKFSPHPSDLNSFLMNFNTGAFAHLTATGDLRTGGKLHEKSVGKDLVSSL